MTYICLAAGKGTRFAGLSSYLQKCMYPVGIHPFVEYSVAHLVSSSTVDTAGDELVFVVGHHGDQLRAYFGDSYRGLRVRYVEQREQLGTGHAVDTARKEIGFTGAAVVWLADLFVSATQFDAIRRVDAATALTLAESDHELSDDVRIDIESGRVVRAWRGSSSLFDIGLWKLGPEVLDIISSTRLDEYRVLVNVQKAIEAGAEVGYQIVEEWVHLGGVEPTVAENIRQVAARMLAEETVFSDPPGVLRGDAT